MKWILFVLLTVNLVHARPTPNTDSVLLLNTTTNRVEMSRNADRVRAIASITKIMTAMVALDYDKDLSRRLTLTKRVGSYLPRQQYTREQLLEAMLVKSDNAAAETLAEDYPGGRPAFIKEMNRHAENWDLKHTRFEDASGLGAGNTSTVHDVAAMMTVAANYWFIRETSVKKQVAFETRYKKKIRTIRLDHTSGNILFTFDNIVVSKTGFTNPAGFCMGLILNRQGHEFIVIVLGEKNKNQRTATVARIMRNLS